MSSVSPELERLIRGIGPPESIAYGNLRTAIESSPVLTAQLNAAAAWGYVQSFALLDSRSSAGASFSPGTRSINLKLDDLLSLAPPQRDTLVFMLGHEAEHAFNRARTEQALSRFVVDVQRVHASGVGTVHDYTAAMRQMLEAHRTDEARAHIAGWNALVSRVTREIPDATLKDLFAREVGYVRTEFIEQRTVDGETIHAAKPGIRLEPDLCIVPDEHNIEALARHYFDQTADQIRLGTHRNSDYANYYASNLIGLLCQDEMSDRSTSGRLTLDMRALKLDEPLLEQNGIALGVSPGPGVRCAYRDAGAPEVERYFDHTVDSHRHVPVGTATAGLSMDNPAHPGHTLFTQARDRLRVSSAEHGLVLDARQADNLAAALAVRAREAGLTRIDDVSPSTDGKEMWAAQGPLGTLRQKLARADIAQGSRTPMAQSSQDYDMTAAQAEARHLQQAWDAPQHARVHARSLSR